ncbi:hypothetical protein J1782_08680 [Rahnella sp. BCC 1045]|uniref:hypothetical protein n=1 Tax=Rahnella sp. BCC 1045 TaxID=2816251 RepID=UPI001C278B87|nr:hypothetical protein [Rahnella sp. BCC 1045]MBU9819962.1 hypothetical protein [Rahnella sp. BCC 1045]
MKKVFDGYAGGNHRALCPAEPAAQKASYAFVQQRNIDSGDLSEMKNSNEVAEREAAR